MLKDRRFESFERLAGTLQPLERAHVAVIGLGGVGSWAAEALVRSGLKKLTLMDLDEVCVSNINRQVQAIDSTVGQLKVESLRQRFQQIRHDLELRTLLDFYTESSAPHFWEDGIHYDAVIDATDSQKAKISLYWESQLRQVPLLLCGSAGGRSETHFKITDLARVRDDALLSLTRRQIRRQGREKSIQLDNKMKVEALWIEHPKNLFEASCYWKKDIGEGQNSGSRMDCAKFGSYVVVTGAMGFRAADWAIKKIYQCKT